MSTELKGRDGLTLEAFSRMAGCNVSTMRKWGKTGHAPRRTKAGPRNWPRVSHAEAAAWLAKRAADQQASGNAFLKRPLQPLSWISDAEIAGLGDVLASGPQEGRQRQDRARDGLGQLAAVTAA